MNERDEFLCNRIDNLAAIIEHLGKLREREKDQFLRNVLARYTITLDEYKKQLLTDNPENICVRTTAAFTHGVRGFMGDREVSVSQLGKISGSLAHKFNQKLEIQTFVKDDEIDNSLTPNKLRSMISNSDSTWVAVNFSYFQHHLFGIMRNPSKKDTYHGWDSHHDELYFQQADFDPHIAFFGEGELFSRIKRYNFHDSLKIKIISFSKR